MQHGVLLASLVERLHARVFGVGFRLGLAFVVLGLDVCDDLVDLRLRSACFDAKLSRVRDIFYQLGLLAQLLLGQRVPFAFGSDTILVLASCCCVHFGF
ncbi:hypothetical protein D3C84_1010120 [compost metagenome]